MNTDTLLESLSQRNAEILAILVALVAVLLLSNLILWLKVRKSSKRWKTLLEGVKGDNLERLLYDHLRDRMQLQSQIDALGEHISELQARMQTSKRHLGLVRYDAFDDVGGSQSFALAVYDDKGDGAIITSLIGRNDCRVYCKPLVNGRSERSLSQEEQRAVQEATQTGPKAIISP